MGKRRRENDIDEAPRSKRGSQADEEDDVFQITQGQSQEKDEPMDNFQDDLEESGENVWTLTAGTIVYVKMKNFMCHAEFVYKPINRINFISGANGSGKSAVLAALQFALGGNARLANRGTTNKNFIRTNQPNASVEVALFNQGENEYKREIYGKRLIIHRTVNTSGVTCLKFKDENGKVVIDKVNKDDLDRVLINFNIQIDNPIALLNQDTAKTFLFKCQPDKLYEFFMKATQLDECTRIYEDALKGIEDSKKSLQLKFGQLKKLKEESEKWEKKYENLKNLDKKNEDISDLKHELASAMLIEQSAIYQNVVNELEKLDKQILVHQNCIDKEEADKKELHDQKNMILSDIQALNEEIEKHQDNLSEMREDVRKMKTSKIDLERDANDRSQKKVHIEGQLKQVVVAIKKIRQTDGDAIARATKEREDKIQDMKSNKDALKARISTTRNHITNLEHTIESTRSEFKAQESKIKATKAEQAQINRQIKAIKSSGKNR